MALAPSVKCAIGLLAHTDSVNSITMPTRITTITGHGRATITIQISSTVNQMTILTRRFCLIDVGAYRSFLFSRLTRCHGDPLLVFTLSDPFQPGWSNTDASVHNSSSPLNASNPEMTSNSSSSMLCWRKRWKSLLWHRCVICHICPGI
jgi:hypothetical protein